MTKLLLLIITLSQNSKKLISLMFHLKCYTWKYDPQTQKSELAEKYYSSHAHRT